MADAAACPNAQDLAAFAAAGLEAKRRSELELHFDACEACSTKIAALIGGVAASTEGDSAAASGEDELAARAPPSYRLHRLVGSGGMGRVYEAEEVRTGRRVALKLAKEVEGPANAALRLRFFREARVAALLQHPNIVPVFDIGEFPDGAPYYTQRLIQGRSLGSVIAACRSARERVALVRHFRDLCAAIAFAHQKGVIHRDVKAANVIVGDAGETWVLDWGLARTRPASGGSAPSNDAPLLADALDALRSDPGLTQVGAAMGTPAYMSPEQARGESRLVDERSDVWSLGILLFEILAGEQAFAGLEAKEVLRRLRAGEGPRLPRRVAAQVPPELCSIAAKALAVEREARYPSAVELAADVNSWMVGGTVSGYRYSLAQRLRRQVRRHPALTAAAAVALLAGVGWGLSVQAANRRLRMERADVLIDFARRATQQFMFDRAAVDFAAALALDGTRTGARIGLAATGDRAPRPLWKQASSGGRPEGLAFTDARTLVSLGHEGLAVAYDVATGSELARTAVEGPVAAMAGCRSGEVALAVGAGVVLWSPGGARLGPRLPHPGPVQQVVFDQSCELLASASRDGVRVFRAGGGELLARLGEGEEALAVAFLAGRRLAWATRAALHERADALAPGGGSARGLPGQVKQLSYAEGMLLATLEDGVLVRFDVGSPGLPAPLPDLRTVPLAVHAHVFPDGRAAAVVTARNFGIWFIDTDTGQRYCRMPSNTQPLLSSALSPDGRWLAVGSRDRVLRVLDLARSRSYAGSRPRDAGHPSDLDFSPRGDHLASVDEDGTVRLWSAAGGTPLRVLGRHQGGARLVRFAPDGARLASSGPDGVRLWDLERGGGAPEGSAARGLAWLQGGALVAGREDGEVARRGADGRWTTLHREHQQAVLALAASRDGRLLVSGDGAGTMVLADAATGRQLNRWTGPGPVELLALSPDGERVASAGAGSAVHLWHAASGSAIAELEDYATDLVTGLDFAPAGSDAAAPGTLMAGYRSGMLALWRAGEKAPLVILQPAATALVGVRHSPDGRRAAMLDATGSLRILPLVADFGPDPLARLMRLYKFEPAGADFMRDEQALVPPALRPGAGLVGASSGQ